MSIGRLLRGLRQLTLATLASWSCVGWAIGPEPGFENPALESEYQALIREVRCLVCQNQTIADSTAPLAADLRREIRDLMADGASRAEVVRFLVDRYGDFVLYRPPLKPSTWALWGAPIFLCAVGLLVFVRVVRSRLQQSMDDELPSQ